MCKFLCKTEIKYGISLPYSKILLHKTARVAKDSSAQANDFRLTLGIYRILTVIWREIKRQYRKINIFSVRQRTQAKSWVQYFRDVFHHKVGVPGGNDAPRKKRT